MTVDGNEAAASVAYRVSESIAIYPITPSSPMAELCDEWASRQKPNLWGGIPEMAEMQSEGGAAGDGEEGAAIEGADAEADPMYDQAVAVVLKTRRPSISLVQRHLRQLARERLVGPAGEIFDRRGEILSAARANGRLAPDGLDPIRPGDVGPASRSPGR